ncbi:DNA replication/repair protein RecF [Rhabdochromatium marinum]|uniref:DNA replication/repair protein RecF n=1 Tax=Rhabdochromatium marinum TaxID=48729 RepID=UPI001905D470|nr:DNA replication and repair protein RecF [Rhabdochromatium marinum]MBK1647957.1 hypothetical protein [Rhabdochromatium marinum]
MWIRRLQAEGIRNLKPFDLECGSSLNLIYGGNGAGKTSFLEAIYFLHRGNTFRGKKAGGIRTFGAERCFVQCWLEDQNGFVWRGKQVCGNTLSEAPQESFPKPRGFMVRLISDSIYQLVEGSPELRRRFIDWNLFHVEPGYGKLMRQYRRTASQRNAWLRAGAWGPAVWDQHYVALCRRVEQYRQAFCDALNERLADMSSGLAVCEGGLKLKWLAGFNSETLEVDLQRMHAADKKRGFTFLSPDRTDFQVLAPKRPGLGSRGENKTAAILLQLVASRVMSGDNRTDIWLVDDLGSELAAENAQSLLQHILQQGQQVFLTALKPETVDVGRLFHVEQGIVQEKILA